MTTPKVRVMHDVDGDGFIPRRQPVGTLVATMPADTGGYVLAGYAADKVPVGGGATTVVNAPFYHPVKIEPAVKLSDYRQDLPPVFYDVSECSPIVRSGSLDPTAVDYAFTSGGFVYTATGLATAHPTPPVDAYSDYLGTNNVTTNWDGLARVVFGASDNFEAGSGLRVDSFTAYKATLKPRKAWTLTIADFDSAKRYKTIFRVAVRQRENDEFIEGSVFTPNVRNAMVYGTTLYLCYKNSAGTVVGTQTLTGTASTNRIALEGSAYAVKDFVLNDVIGSTYYRAVYGGATTIEVSLMLTFGEFTGVAYNNNYAWLGDTEFTLLGAWIVEAPEILLGTPSEIGTTPTVDGDITEWITSASWELGGAKKTDLVSGDTDAVFNIYNDGRFTDGTITLPVGSRIVVETPVEVLTHDGTYLTQHQRMWTGYVEQTVPVVGHPNNMQGEIRASVGVFRSMDGLEVDLTDQDFPITIRPDEVTVANIPDIFEPDYWTDGVSIIVDEWAAIFTPKTYSVGDVMKKVLERGSWKSAGTLTGFRLNEGLLGTSTVLVDMSAMVDVTEATKEIPFVGKSYTFKGRTVGDMLETLAKTEWAHVLTDRSGGLKVRKVSQAVSGIPTLTDSNGQVMRYSINPDETYNMVQVEYTPIELVPADIIRTRESDNDDSADDLDELKFPFGYKRSVAAGTLVKWVRDVKGLALWRADKSRDDWGFDGYYGRDKVRPINTYSDVEFIPYDVDKHTLVKLMDGTWQTTRGGDSFYYRAASVVYSSPAGAGTWTLENNFQMPDYNFDRTPSRKGKVIQARKKDGKFVVGVYNTTGSAKDYWIKRLTGLWCIEREKETAYSEFIDPTAQIETVKSYTVLNSAVTNEADAIALADEIVTDLLPKKEYTEYEFIVRDAATLDIMRTIGIGDRVNITSSTTPIEADNVHLIVGEKHSVSGGYWNVVYLLRRVEDM